MTVNTRAAAVVLAVAGALGLVACSSGSSGSAASGSSDPSAIVGNAYVSTTVVRDGVETAPVVGSSVEVTFDQDHLAVNAGCNTLSGGATFDGGVITISNALASTLMACPQELMDQDAWLAEFFSGNPEWTANGDTVTITSGTESIELQKK